MDQHERSELIAKLFYIMTAELEDAAAMAADGQSGMLPGDARLALAGRIHSAAQRVTIIAEAISAMLPET